MNYTGRNYTDEVGPSPIFKTVSISLWLVALVSNGISLNFLLKEARQRCSLANILLCCIASQDLFILLIVLPPFIVALFAEDILENNQGLCYFQGCVLNTLSLMTIFMAALVSLDQYLALSHPFFYSIRILRNERQSNRILLIVLSLLFLVSASLSTVPLAVGMDYIPLIPPLLCYYDLQSKSVPTTVFLSMHTSLFLISGCLLVFCSCSVGCRIGIAYRSTREEDSTVLDRQQIAFGKLTVMTTIQILAFSVPFEIVCIHHLLSYYIDYRVDFITLCFLMTITVVNPFLYMFVRASIRRAMKDCLIKCIRTLFECCRSINGYCNRETIAYCMDNYICVKPRLHLKSDCTTGMTMANYISNSVTFHTPDTVEMPQPTTIEIDTQQGATPDEGGAKLSNKP